MMLNRNGFLIVATAACFATTVPTQTSHAGQWLDSILGRRPPAYPVGTPVPVNGQVSAYSPGAYPSLGYVPPAYANLNANLTTNQTLGYGSYAPNLNAPLLPPGFPQTVAAHLPTAAYDTQWARTPVTYYRPVTAYDPRYGSVVTSLQPCTSYQYQAQRQPVIAPRPLLGEYGFQANRWPSITGPGYNPTGLAASPAYPAYPTYQSIPNGGMPYAGQTAAMAPIGGSGVSSGMPTSPLPLTTMPYNPAGAGQPYASQQAYYGGQTYAAGPAVVNSGYASVPNAGWPSQSGGAGAIGSGVVPTAAWSPSTHACPNGVCAPQANPMAIPSIPGAASVTPVGPPTYSSVPSAASSYGATSTVNPAAPANSNPGYYTPTNNPNPLVAPPVLPNIQAMPPTNNSSADPDANLRPKLGSNTATEAARNAIESPSSVQTLPLVAIDRHPSSNGLGIQSSAGAKESRDAVALGSNRAPQPGVNEMQPMKPGPFDGAPPIPQTLAPRGNVGMQPLNAPEELDSNPRWTPTLLDPDDRVALERSAAKFQEASGRIRVGDDEAGAVSAVAFETAKSPRGAIQLVGGIETKKPEQVDSNAIRFRPISKLK